MYLYISILREIYMTVENADISKFSNILQSKVKFYKYQNSH